MFEIRACIHGQNRWTGEGLSRRTAIEAVNAGFMRKTTLPGPGG